MTALRPERDGTPYGEYDAQDAAYEDSAMFRDAAYGDAALFEAGTYGDATAFAAAVEQLADPLNDPLPNRGFGQDQEHQQHGRHSQPPDPYQSGHAQGQLYAAPHDPLAVHPLSVPYPDPAAHDPLFGPYPTAPEQQQPYRTTAPEQPHRPTAGASHRKPAETGTEFPGLFETPGVPQGSHPAQAPQEARQTPRQAAYGVVPYDATVGLRTADTRRSAASDADAGAADGDGLDGVVGAGAAGVASAAGAAGVAGGAAGAAATGAGGAAGALAAAAAAAGGRAARRRAAKQRGGGGGRRRAGGRHDGRQQDTRAAGRRGATSGPQGSGGGHRAGGRRAAHDAGGETSEGTESTEASAPLTRMAARRAARAAKPSAGVVASQMVGEVFISIGVLMLLFVTYSLWWTNVRAHEEANGAAHSLQDDWASGKGKPGVFAPGQGFALIHIPKLDVVVPIAEGTNKHTVLDRGMVGHYGGPNDIQTAMPDAKTGNFALAGHRNTHGEPFRYINRLVRGDKVVVETQDTYYVYMVTSTLPQTPPTNTSVIGPVPPQSGFAGPGRYITLTTCTPEFTSKYRLIVWGKMVEERPRSEGKPKALVG